MALPYPTKVVLPFDIATAQDMNERHANDVALAAGTGLDDEAVTAPKLAQSAIDALGSYSTSEVATSYKWIDGKAIYRKTMNFGSLPASGTKQVAHGIASLDSTVSLGGVAKAGTLEIPVPYANPTAASSVALFRDGANIGIVTGSDRTSYSAYITIHYTKT